MGKTHVFFWRGSPRIPVAKYHVIGVASIRGHENNNSVKVAQLATHLLTLEWHVVMRRKVMLFKKSYMRHLICMLCQCSRAR